MALRIEDYALIGDTQSVALIGRDGSCDWLCLPRFDSPACFAALLGEPSHGRWSLAPRGAGPAASRRYRPGTLVLESTFVTPSGRVRVIDCMPPRDLTPDIVRVVEGLEGEVEMRTELVIRFDYGSIMPWVRRLPDGRLGAIAGADALVLQAGVETHGEGPTTAANFVVRAGERVAFVLSWHPSHHPPPPSIEPLKAIEDTEAWWLSWSARCRYEGPWKDEVASSLVVLKALTYAPTGGIVAAATTSLPEWPGGVRNWDYRFCWLRDATYSLYALMLAGYREEAEAWLDVRLNAVLMSPTCEKACGKLPSCRRRIGSYSSASRPTSLRSASSRSNRRRASSCRCIKA